MARTAKSSFKPAKEPGRLKQMYQVFQMTRRYDATAVWWMALGFALPVLVGIVLAIVLSLDSVFGIVLWITARFLNAAAEFEEMRVLPSL